MTVLSTDRSSALPSVCFNKRFPCRMKQRKASDTHSKIIFTASVIILWLEHCIALFALCVQFIKKKNITLITFQCLIDRTNLWLSANVGKQLFFYLLLAIESNRRGEREWVWERTSRWNLNLRSSKCCCRFLPTIPWHMSISAKKWRQENKMSFKKGS